MIEASKRRGRDARGRGFTQALNEILEKCREENNDNWRSLADRLEVHESLLSLYRSGQRYPDIRALLDYEEVFPGMFMGELLRLTTLYSQTIELTDGDQNLPVVPTTDEPAPFPPRQGADLAVMTELEWRVYLHEGLTRIEHKLDRRTDDSLNGCLL